MVISINYLLKFDYFLFVVNKIILIGIAKFILDIITLHSSFILHNYCLTLFRVE